MRGGKLAHQLQRARIFVELGRIALGSEELRELIDQKYDSHEAAREAISTGLTEFYVENYPEVAAERVADIEAAATALGDAYSVNVFPTMNVWWDTYPNHLGHEQSDGCFRCHKRSMRTDKREQVSNDCDNCHVLLAEEEENPNIMSVLRPE